GLGQRLRLFGERRQLAVRRIDQQRGAAAGSIGFDPVAHADRAVLVLALVSLVGGIRALRALSVFLVVQPEAIAEVRRAIHRNAGDVVDRPGAAQIGIAPRGFLGLIVF